MLARCLGILVVSCALGSQLACGSATADDADTGADDGVADVPEVADETSLDVPEADADGSGCEAGLTDCSGSCVDLTSDPEHCGACDTVCDDGLNAVGACDSRVCGLRCEPGFVDVDGEPGCELACTPSTPAVEDCDGVDDDCNGLTDDGAGFECEFGATEACTTSCGTTGTNTCTDECTWDCVPPDEVCDGEDQDCDGVVDDGLYGVVWRDPRIDPAPSSVISSFSVAVAAGEAALGYVESSIGGGALGHPWFRRFRIADGMDPGGLVGLSPSANAHRISAGGSENVVSFAWDTGDDLSPAGESVVNRGAALGTGFLLGTSETLDSAVAVVSSVPTIARMTASDSAVVAWLEFPAGGAQLEVASTAAYTRPGRLGWTIVAIEGAPRDPSIAIHGDETILVAWAAGLPADIQVQRLTADLEPLGIAQNLSNTDAAESNRPGVAAAGGGFLVVWEETGVGVMLSTLGPDGTVHTTDATLATGGATDPVVAPDLGGGFAVAYATDDGVELVRVNAEGTPHGEPLAFDGASSPALAAIPGGGLILAFLEEGSVRLVRIGCPP